MGPSMVDFIFWSVFTVYSKMRQLINTTFNRKAPSYAYPYSLRKSEHLQSYQRVKREKTRNKNGLCILLDSAIMGKSLWRHQLSALDFRDVIRMVYKMASVGSVQENSCCEESTDNFVKKTYAGINDMCKKNGISTQCSCGENPIKNYHPKRGKTPRLNGIRPSIPTLRSRTAPTTERRTSLSDYPLQKRRSPRTEKPDNVDG
jgi:hypothetical protein